METFMRFLIPNPVEFDLALFAFFLVLFAVCIGGNIYMMMGEDDE